MSFITILSVTKAYEEGTEKTNITCSTTSFALTVDDINDNAPNFTKPNYTGSVDENAKISISFDESIVVKDIDQVGCYDPWRFYGFFSLSITRL